MTKKKEEVLGESENELVVVSSEVVMIDGVEKVKYTYSDESVSYINL